MKSSTVWHGHSTQPSLPAGTARKASGHLSGRRPLHLANARPFGRSKAPLGLLLLRKRELAYGRRNRLITPPVKKNRAFPTGNALLYISLSHVDFSGCVLFGGAPCFLFCLIFPCSAVLFSLPTGCKRRPLLPIPRTQTTLFRCPWCG